MTATATTHPTLFDQDVTEPVRGGVRRTDGLPSHLVANDPAAKMRWGSQRARLLSTYVTWGAMTDDKAGRHIGLTHEQATRRICELLKDGLLVETRTYGVSALGNTARLCAVTDAGRRAATAALSKTAQRSSLLPGADAGRTPGVVSAAPRPGDHRK